MWKINFVYNYLQLTPNSTCWSIIIIIVSRAQRLSARCALSQPYSQETAIYHGPARGVQLRLGRGRAGQTFDHVKPTGSWSPSGSLPAERTGVEVQDSPRRMVRLQAKHMSIPADPAAGSQRRPGAVRQGPAPFHWKRGRASGCQESIWEPYCQSRQAWRRGFQWTARSPCSTAEQTGLQHCICASWWYAK